MDVRYANFYLPDDFLKFGRLGHRKFFYGPRPLLRPLFFLNCDIDI